MALASQALREAVIVAHEREGLEAFALSRDERFKGKVAYSTIWEWLRQNKAQTQALQQ